MFEWLFPGWSEPLRVAAFVAARLACNAALTALVARAVGPASRLTAAAAALTLFSAVATVLLLRPGGLGYGASFVELGAQVVLLALAGYAVRAAPTPWRAVAGVVVGVVAVGLGFLTVVLYGEAFVAP